MLLGRARFIKYRALERRIVLGRNVIWDLAQCRAQMEERERGDTVEIVVKAKSVNDMKSEQYLSAVNALGKIVININEVQ